MWHVLSLFDPHSTGHEWARSPSHSRFTSFLSSSSLTLLLLGLPPLQASKCLNASGGVLSPLLYSSCLYSVCLTEFIEPADFKYHPAVNHSHASESRLDLASELQSSHLRYNKSSWTRNNHLTLTDIPLTPSERPGYWSGLSWTCDGYFYWALFHPLSLKTTANEWLW